MSKTITIDNHIIDIRMFADFCEHDLLADGITVAANALDQPGVPRYRWLATSLIAMTESGAYVLTPRGQDLRASLSSFPAEPEVKPNAKPCSKCNGLGERPLFAYLETCDHCKGSKVEPKLAADAIERWVTETMRGIVFGVDLSKPSVHDATQVELYRQMAAPQWERARAQTARYTLGEHVVVQYQNAQIQQRFRVPRVFMVEIDDQVVEYTSVDLQAKKSVRLGTAQLIPGNYYETHESGAGPARVVAHAIIVGKDGSRMPVSHTWVQS